MSEGTPQQKDMFNNDYVESPSGEVNAGLSPLEQREQQLKLDGEMFESINLAETSIESQEVQPDGRIEVMVNLSVSVGDETREEKRKFLVSKSEGRAKGVWAPTATRISHKDYLSLQNYILEVITLKKAA